MPRFGSQRTSGWTEDYNQAVANANNENKKLLLDFTGSDWCGHCMDLEKEVFRTSKFQTWASNNAVLVKVDFPEHHPQNTRVKTQNAQLEAKYKVNGFPTVLLVDNNGNVLGRMVGYNPGSGPDAYLADLQNVVKS